MAGPDVAGRADAVRKVGNIAVHDNRTINEQTALLALRQVYDFARWAAFHYSTAADVVPTGTAYNPSLIPAPSSGSERPLSKTELNELIAAFEIKDVALAEAKSTSASLQAEIDELRVQVKAAKSHPAAEVDFDEAPTRRDFIDIDLLAAGWPLTDERDREYPVTGMPNSSGKGFVDYVLWGDDGLPLAVIGAKRSLADPSVGQQQADPVLTEVADYLTTAQTSFEVNGHTDSIGTDEFNLDLSERRSDVVWTGLQERGLAVSPRSTASATANR